MKEEKSESNVETKKTKRIESDDKAEFVKSTLTANEDSNAGTANQSGGRENNPNMRCGGADT